MSGGFRCSNLPLLTKCAGSLWLPHSEWRDEKQVKKQQDGAFWGHIAHAWKETGDFVYVPSAPDDLQPTPENQTTVSRGIAALRKAVSTIGPEKRFELWPVSGRHEVEIAIRCDGTRETKVGPGVADLPLPWITGHVDYTDVLVDGTLWVDDLKTSKRYYDRWTGEERFRPSPRSPQLLAYALALAYDSRPPAIVTSITHWPRLPLTDRHAKPVRYATDVEWGELMEMYTHLEYIYNQVEWQNGPYEVGDHCKFCDSQLDCNPYQKSKEDQYGIC